MRLINWSHPLNRSLVAWWIARPGLMSGRTWMDLVQASHGALTGTVWTASPARPGGYGCLRFSGTNESALVGRPTAVQLGTSDFTIAAWMRSTSRAGYPTIIVKQILVSPFTGYALYLDAVSGALSFQTLVTTTTTRLDSLTTGLDDSTWHRVIATRSGANLQLFIDGVLDNFGAVGDAGDLEAASDCTIGSFSDQASQFWTGDLDDIRIWKGRAFNETDAKQDYRSATLLSYDGLFQRPRMRVADVIPVAAATQYTWLPQVRSQTGRMTVVPSGVIR